ncbi:sigma-like protein [Streptomyces sp. CC228A]|uniref:sigma-like protein n=1 Tax=Streptomyces sp. CC228A TaxID=2898186 RepID=UPI001F1D65D6|nr:sigma-like protein [Streptomyces sp. CC228A]
MDNSKNEEIRTMGDSHAPAPPMGTESEPATLDNPAPAPSGKDQQLTTLGDSHAPAPPAK